MEIPLGSKVKDSTSGFTGHVTSRTEYISGCIQYFVEAEINEKGEIPPGYNIDVTNLIVLSSGAVAELAAIKSRLEPGKAPRVPRGGPRQPRARSKPS